MTAARVAEYLSRGTDAIESRDSAIHAAYLNGDAPELARLVQASEDFDDKVLLSERNSLWLGKLEAAQAANAFVAVGAAHLLGKDNLLERLKERGYRVSRVEATIANVRRERELRMKQAADSDSAPIDSPALRQLPKGF